eukprot:scaffold13863_cov35-Tisochrysis_lutea.AAC.2
MDDWAFTHSWASGAVVAKFNPPIADVLHLQDKAREWLIERCGPLYVCPYRPSTPYRQGHLYCPQVPSAPSSASSGSNACPPSYIFSIKKPHPFTLAPDLSPRNKQWTGSHPVHSAPLCAGLAHLAVLSGRRNGRLRLLEYAYCFTRSAQAAAVLPDARTSSRIKTESVGEITWKHYGIGPRLTPKRQSHRHHPILLARQVK